MHCNSALIEKVPLNKNANGIEPDGVMGGFVCWVFVQDASLLSRPWAPHTHAHPRF